MTNKNVFTLTALFQVTAILCVLLWSLRESVEWKVLPAIFLVSFISTWKSKSLNHGMAVAAIASFVYLILYWLDFYVRTVIYDEKIGDYFEDNHVLYTTIIEIIVYILGFLPLAILCGVLATMSHWLLSYAINKINSSQENVG